MCNQYVQENLEYLRQVLYGRKMTNQIYALLLATLQCRIAPFEYWRSTESQLFFDGMHTVYPNKYAHGFCFAVLCCGYTLTDFPISIRLTSLALWQSNDCPSASKATLMNMDKYSMWIHYERLHNHNQAKHNKTVCIFLGIYCITDGMCLGHGGEGLYTWLHHLIAQFTKLRSLTMLMMLVKRMVGTCIAND